MPILKNCCVCFDLKVGSMIIGVINLINAIVNTLMFAVLVVMMVFMDAGAKAVREHHPIFNNDDDDYADVEEAQKAILEIIIDNIAVVKIVCFVLLAVCLLCVITSSMLIHGITHKRRGLLMPFIVQELINIIVFIGLIIFALVVLGTHNVVVYSVLGIVAGILVHLYCLLVIVSQYQALGLIRMHEEISMK